MKRALVVVAVVVAIAVIAAFLTGWKTTTTPLLDAAKIDAEISRLENLKSANWRWARLRHNRVGTAVVNGRRYPVYYDAGEAIVYASVRQKAEISDFSKYQPRVNKELERQAQRLGLAVNLNFTSSSGDGVLAAVVEEKSSPHGPRMEALRQQLYLAAQEVEHPRLKFGGQTVRVLSDTSFRYFVAIRPWSASGGALQSATDSYVSKIASSHGTTYTSLRMESEPYREPWFQRLRRLLAERLRRP